MFRPTIRPAVPVLAGLGAVFFVHAVADPLSARAAVQGSVAEKALASTHQKVLAADALLAAGKWAEAEKLLTGGLQTLIDASKRDNSLANRSLTLGPKDFAFGRSLGLDFRELAEPTKQEVVGSRYFEFLQALLRVALQVQGKDPESNDESILDFTVGDVRNIDPPVPDAQAASAEARLKVAVAKLEGVLQRSPKLKGEAVRGMTGEQALADARAKLAKVSAQAKEAAPALAAALPDRVKLAQEVLFTEIDRAREGLVSKGWVPDTQFERLLADPAKLLQREENLYRAAYTEEGKQMPANALDPVKAKLADLKRTAEASAAKFTFPAGTLPDPAIAKKVTGQLTGNVPGLKVLKVGIADRAWTIRKNEVGVPEARFKMGYVLYQWPGEKFARCSSFLYTEEYAGGGTYTPGDRASSYGSTRWQAAK